MNYENLPVYKETFDLLLFVYKNLTQVSREYRYTLVEEQKHALQDMLSSIYHANIVRDKVPYISQARGQLVKVRVLFRVLIELKQVSDRQTVIIMDHIASISKQLTAWESYTLKNKST